MTANHVTQSTTYYHGTKADLNPDDLIIPGYRSNFGQRKKSAFTYFTATLDAAVWGAELALGDALGRIYQVEPSGPFEDDPNLTDKKFPGNPTQSFRTREALIVKCELSDWQGHPEPQLNAMQAHLAKLTAAGVEAIME